MNEVADELNAAAISRETNGALKPAKWNGTDEDPPVEDFFRDLLIYMIASNIPDARRGITALTFLGARVKQHVYQHIDFDNLTPASFTFDTFKERVRQVPAGGLTTDLAIYVELMSMRMDIYKPADTVTYVLNKESMMARLKQAPCDNTKQFFMWHGLHPDLRAATGYQVNGQPWDDYDSFRANVLSLAPHFDKDHKRPPVRNHNPSSSRPKRSNGKDNIHKTSNSGVQKPTPGVRCWRCHQTGHLGRDCPNPRVDTAE